MMAGTSPSHPKSMAPVLIASIIGGPSSNFDHFTTTPNGSNHRSKTPCDLATLSKPAFS
jgi:hypothetical protein